VMGSRGSVIPLFESQIRKGGPVTLTDPDMRRFMMSIRQAVDLVFKATKISQGGEIFIFKMPVIKLGDLTKVMIEHLAPKYGYKPEEIKINNIGIRNGKKMYEPLMTVEEAKYAYETDDMFIIVPQSIFFKYVLEGAIKTGLQKYDSNDADICSREEIIKLLDSL
jgi:UDP-N-acetylglucosamine 4,6-dehydratase